MVSDCKQPYVSAANRIASRDSSPQYLVVAVCIVLAMLFRVEDGPGLLSVTSRSEALVPLDKMHEGRLCSSNRQLHYKPFDCPASTHTFQIQLVLHRHSSLPVNPR
eukprot:913200-Rhodomonas_salina.2